MSKRRTALLLGLLPVVAVGLSACTSSSGRPQVQDLSISRNSEPSSTYTVKNGDTIYGIAWQNRVDFRDLAQLNGISPPYRLEPGQQLRLKPGASVSGGQAVASRGVVATGLGSGSGAGSSQSATGEVDNPSWLLPAEAKIWRPAVSRKRSTMASMGRWPRAAATSPTFSGSTNSPLKPSTTASSRRTSSLKSSGSQTLVTTGSPLSAATRMPRGFNGR